MMTIAVKGSAIARAMFTSPSACHESVLREMLEKTLAMVGKGPLPDDVIDVQFRTSPFYVQPSPSAYFGAGGYFCPFVAEEKETQPGPRLREYQGSFIGYRAWRIQRWQLAGTGVSAAWTPGVNEATCQPEGGFSSDWHRLSFDRHKAPHPMCNCGLYALARFDDRADDRGGRWWTNADVLGAVEAWADPDENNRDRFFLHATGFRAQYAKIVLLAVDDANPRAKNGAIRALATEHGADVCKREHLEAAAKEHGQLVPDDLLAWAAADSEDRQTPAATAAMSTQTRQMAQPAHSLKATGKTLKEMIDALGLENP